MSIYEIIGIISAGLYAFWTLFFIAAFIVCFIREELRKSKATKDESQKPEYLDEEDEDRIISICCSALDSHMAQQSEVLKECYDVPDGVELDHESIYLTRVLLSFYAFMWSHGIEAYIKHLDGDYSFDEEATYTCVTEESEKENEHS